ncbi:MAG: hypothetical protein K2X81_26295, partial [Candidatus Obscuribacterales bacterium]|nr:hypothetical protein [Candidatus Obscuribacterales bacterium]
HPGDDYAVCIESDGHSKLLGIQNGTHPRYYDADFCDENPIASMKDIISKAQKSEISSFLLLGNLGVSQLLPERNHKATRRTWSNNDAMFSGAEAGSK